MIDWILANPEAAGAIAGVVIAILLAAIEVLRRTGSIRQALLTAMLRAERARRKGDLPFDGPAIMELVITWAMGYLRPRMPLWLRPMLTEDRFRRWAQSLYNGALDLLDDGLLNGSRPAPLPDSQT